MYDMDVLFLCGFFEEQYEPEISKKTRAWMENAANTFQKRILQGMKGKVNLTIVSAPFVGAWPQAYDDVIFRGFQGEKSENVRYVSFLNIWGVRNYSRASAMKRAVRSFLASSTASKKAVIVYSPHTPFLEAGLYAKKIEPSVHVCMIVPDLPQYMNLKNEKRGLYDFLKKFDINKFNRLCKDVDSFVVLTKYMVDSLKIASRPYEIIEGIADENKKKSDHPKGKTFAYAGKLVEAFGAKRMIEAFEMLEDADAVLDICGGGELKAYIERESQRDRRIRYHGIVSASDAGQILDQADVLINPRQNTEEYTKYSFPSKNIEYLQTGNAVIAYLLSGMPAIYERFIIEPENDTVEALADAMKRALRLTSDEKDCMYELAAEYISNNITADKAAERIIGLLCEV